MRFLPSIAGALLGLMFVAFGALYFLDLVPAPEPPPEGSWPALFMAAFYPSGYLDFVKTLEILGGLLVAVPRTRNLGLLVLGPIIVNILAFHLFIMQGEGLSSPIILIIVALALYLLWAGRTAFGGLLRQPAPAQSAPAPAQSAPVQ